MKFEKVSFAEYRKEFEGYYDREIDDIQKEWEDIKLPKRATKGSAGHDFFSPFPFRLSTEPDSFYPKTITIPTGIKARLDEDKVLMCYPRSGQGFKFKLQLFNTVGVIDSDYINSNNEGHIKAKLTLDTDEEVTLTIDKGMGFMQGIITQFFVIDEEEVIGERNGGFGSTEPEAESVTDTVKEEIEEKYKFVTLTIPKDLYIGELFNTIFNAEPYTTKAP